MSRIKLCINSLIRRLDPSEQTVDDHDLNIREVKTTTLIEKVHTNPHIIL